MGHDLIKRDTEYEAVIFAPFFKKKSDLFSIWLKSCEKNEKIKFIIFTDCKIDEYTLQSNIQIIRTSFNGFIALFEKKLKINMSRIDNPYKLCDLKPAYGYVLNDYIGNEKYWGYTDQDLICGNILDYLPRKKFDKLSYLGNFCLYLNNNKTKRAFMRSSVNWINYKEIFTNPIHFGFDEIGEYGINNIFLKNGLTIYNLEKEIADVDCTMNGLVLSKKIGEKFKKDKRRRVLSYENGRVYSYYNKNGIITKEQHLLIHIQKRRINIITDKLNKVLITGDKIVDYIPISKKNFNELAPLNTYGKRTLIIKIRALRKKIIRQSFIAKQRFIDLK